MPRTWVVGRSGPRVTVPLQSLWGAVALVVKLLERHLSTPAIVILLSVRSLGCFVDATLPQFIQKENFTINSRIYRYNLNRVMLQIVVT